jgi:hypothetical protein
LNLEGDWAVPGAAAEKLDPEQLIEVKMETVVLTRASVMNGGIPDSEVG